MRMASGDDTDFHEFCKEKGLTDCTVSELERNGYTTMSTFLELTAEDIKTEDFKKIPFRERRHLQRVLKEQKESVGIGLLDTTGDIWEDTDEKGDPDELRIVLLGKTGCGKSSTGNTILNKTRDSGGFLNKGGQAAVTVSSKRTSVKINGRKIRVIDTPGVYDPARKWEEVQHEIVRCLCLCTPGPHALLFVIKSNDRFTKEEDDAYYKVKAMFSNHVNKYIIIAFTRGDELLEDESTLEETLAKAKEDVEHNRKLHKSGKGDIPDLGQVVKDVDDRKVLFNNKANTADKARQVTELMRMIEEMVNNNGDQPYYKDETTQKIWEETEKELDRIMAVRHVSKAEAMQIHQDNLKAEAKKIHQNNVNAAEAMRKRQENLEAEDREFTRRVRATLAGGAGGVAAAAGGVALGVALAPAAAAVGAGAAVVGGAAYVAQKTCSVM
ncbi:uncharacterized protein [Littorina saxatilis]|uniref:uncharacterized protein n=1 Tax=Littorina saxatilis TaxID=31220 RepID=UPI0038B54BEB